MEYQAEYREFEFELTPLELAGRGRDVAGKLAAADTAEQERLRLVAEATEKRKEKKGLDAAALESSRALHAGREKRKQKCEWRPHASAPRMQLHRLDLPEDASGRVVDERQMTKAELKGVFTGEVAASSKEKASDSAEANKAQKPDAKVLDFKEGAEANGSSNGHAEEGKAKAKREILCSYITEQPDLEDPRKDVLCGQAGAAKRKGFCAEHYELTGGSEGNKTQLLCLTRRTRRQQLFREDQEREAEADDRAERAAPAADDQHTHADA